MYKIYPANERTYTKTQWRNIAHSFSFGNHYNAEKTGFGPVRVINDEIVAPGGGLSTHPHDNMEIISIILKGALQHKDSTGHKHILKENDVQKITAGKGIYHSEFNNSKTEPVHFLQLWIIPNKKDLHPSYRKKTFNKNSKLNKFCLIAGPRGKDILHINQSINLYQSVLEKDKKITYQTKLLNAIWIQIASGSIIVNNQIQLSTGDGFALWDEDKLVEIQGLDNESNFILFDGNRTAKNCLPEEPMQTC